MEEEYFFKTCDKADVEKVIEICNQIIDEGNSFPWEFLFDETQGKEMIFSQTETVCLTNNQGEVLGFYILHPNNVGRCSHTANASYGVRKDCRGKGLGELLVRDSLKRAKQHGFVGMQFNAVVSTNYPARHLYEKIGFKKIGVIPKGFRLKDDTLVDTVIYYYSL